MNESAKNILETDEQSDNIMKFETNLKKRLGMKEDVSGLELKYIGESSGIQVAGIFIDGEISKYIGSKGEGLINIDSIKKKKLWYEKSLYMLGYSTYKDDMKGVIYKRDQLDKYTLKPNPQSERVYDTNIEYFNLFKKLDFLINRLAIGAFKDAESEKYIKEFPISELGKFFNLELLKMKDVDDLERIGKISKKSAISLRKDLKKLIRQQCADDRYEITDEEITESELNDYKNKKYIDKKLHEQCIAIIRLRKKKKEDKKQIKEETSLELIAESKSTGKS